MPPKTFVETRLCGMCDGMGDVLTGEVDEDEYEEWEICYSCDGSGLVETTKTWDVGLPEVNPSA